MNKILLILSCFIILFSNRLESQSTKEKLNTEIERTLNQVLITATKTKRQLSTATVPVTLIKQKEIKSINALRVQNVLSEFTGLNTVSSALGTGIQMQGLDADYSLIMIDGVPLIGRLNGVLDLSRISVSNIERIEVVKGPSSVLFGSNALAGVVNIITKKEVKETSLQLEVKAESYNTFDYGINGVVTRKNYKNIFSANYYTTDGYDLASNYQGYNVSTDYYGKTVSPHSNYTFFLQNEFKIYQKIKINLNGRYFNEDVKYKFSDANNALINGVGNVKDWSINPRISYNFNKNWIVKILPNYNQYNTKTDEYFENNSLYSKSYYNEKFTTLDIQTDYKLNDSNEFSLGSGYEIESIQTSRLSDNKFHEATNKYVYLQYILNHNNNLNLVVGTRYEIHENYSSQFNPKISLKYNIAPRYVIRASVGRGYKKPDFKQLYFNYTNNAIGYTVLGTTYVKEGISNLISKNEIALNPESGLPIIYDLYYQILKNNGKIDAESSLGFNFGLSIRSLKNTIIEINFFRNDLKNLIETTPIALKNNGWQAYSYQNLNRVYTQGVEIDLKYYLNDKIKISLGYQYLDAKDKNVINLLDKGKLFAKDIETGISYKIKKNQYGGLLNRPKHNANFKIFASDIWKDFSANLRVFYKGKYGFADLNNNHILDIDKEYVKGYFLINTSVSKKFLNNMLSVNLGIDNILNYTYSTPEFTISSLPGRIFHISIHYKILKNEKN